MITEANKRILNIARKIYADTGRPPTIREVAKASGNVPSVITHHIKILAKAGLVIYKEGSRKGIILPQFQEDWVKMPISRYVELLHLEAKLENQKRTVMKMLEERNQNEAHVE